MVRSPAWQNLIYASCLCPAGARHSAAHTVWLHLAKVLALQSCCMIYKQTLVQPWRPKITEFYGTVKSKLQSALGQLKFFPQEQQCQEGFYKAEHEPEAAPSSPAPPSGSCFSPVSPPCGHRDALELCEECLVCLAAACWGTPTSSGTELENLEREGGRLGTSAKSAAGYMWHTSWCLPSLPTRGTRTLPPTLLKHPPCR